MIYVQCSGCAMGIPWGLQHCAYCGDKNPRRPTNFEMVKEFHDVFAPGVGLSIPVNEIPPRKEVLTKALIEEELNELYKAIVEKDLVEMADAFADLLYVTYRAAYAYGIDIDAVFTEVHRSNMSKLDTDGKPIYREDGKVLKGPNYQPPDVARVLREQGADL